MSNQQKMSELLTFGYVKTVYNGVIPIQLMKLMQLFYDKWIYWVLKDQKLKQFMNAKINKKTMCSKIFNVKGIQFEIYSFPNGYANNKYNLKGLVVIVWKTKFVHVPSNFESFAFYSEIQCEALNCSVKKLKEISANDYTYSNKVICKLSELKNLNSVCFNIMVNMKYIKYKKECNKINYYCPINKMQKYSKFTWNINGSLLKRCKKMYYNQPIYSPNFDNDNWGLMFYPNGGKHQGMSEMYLQCIHFPHNIQSMDVKVKYDCNGQPQTYTKNLKPTKNKIGIHVMAFNEFKEMDSFSFSVTLEIMNVYKQNDVVIEQKNWQTLGITVNDSNKK